MVRGPGQRQRFALRGFGDDRPETGFAHGQVFVGGAAHVDGLCNRVQVFPTIYAGVAVGVLRIHTQFEEIEPVAIAVGEAPGHVAIAAHHHKRRARQAQAGNDALFALRIGIAQLDPEPDVGHPQAQMHVIGENGSAVG